MIDNIDENLKRIKISKYQTLFRQCQQYFEVSCIGDFNDENLYKLSKENSNIFNQLIRVLALYNIKFKGFHSRLNILVDSKETFNFDNDIELKNIIQHEQLKRILINLGFETQKSLNGVNKKRINTYLSNYLPLEIVEKEFDNLSMYRNQDTLSKVIKLNNEMLSFFYNQLAIEIKITDTSMRIISQHFSDDQIIYIRDLPEDLDLYFEV